MNFLITGLPRSKTAWMSVVASTVPGAMCWHEPMARLKSWECCFDLWKDSTYTHVGVSDAHLGFHLPAIMSRANPRILVIRRDVSEVKSSLDKLGAPRGNYVDQLQQSIDQFASGSVYFVSFEALTRLETVKQCLQHLMPGCAQDDKRIQELIDLNIQVDMEIVWQRALESRTNNHKILGAESMPSIKFFEQEKRLCHGD